MGGKSLEAFGSLGHLLAIMTFLAGLHPVIRMYLRFGVIYGINAVAVMAIGALGGIGITKLIDLTVIGILVALDFIFVTITAGLDICQLKFIGRGVDYAVGCVAIGADCCLDISLVDNLFTMDGRRIFLQLILVTLGPTSLGNAAMPGGTPLAALRRDVEFM